MTKKITFQKLLEMIDNEETELELLMQYLIEDQELSLPFRPYFKPNPKFVDDEGLESGRFLNFFNKRARKKRQKKYRRKIKNGWE